MFEPIKRKPAHLVLIDEIRGSVEKPKEREKEPWEVDEEEEIVAKTKTREPILVPTLKTPTFLQSLSEADIRRALVAAKNAETNDPNFKLFQAEEQRQIKKNKLYDINLAFEILSKMRFSEETQGEVVYFLEQIQALPIDDEDIRAVILRHKPLEIAFAGDQTWHQILLKILCKARDFKTDISFSFFFGNMLLKCEITDEERTEIITSLEKLIKKSTNKSVRSLARQGIEILKENPNNPQT